MIHLSRTHFQAGDEKLFEEALNSFTFDPDYQPTPADYAFLANMLPPDMAALYHSTAEVVSNTMPGKANSIDLALIQHPGLLHMDAPNFEPMEYSAKPNGKEFGIRAMDRQMGVMALSFLFLPEPPQPTAIACRDWMLRSEKGGGGYGKVRAGQSGKSTAGVDWTGVEYEQDKKGIIVRRYFVASGDLCADMAFFSQRPTTLHIAETLIETLRFDPVHVPDFFDRFRYAQILYDHREFAAAAPAFESALAVIDGTPDALRWRRIAADHAAMAYGSAGNLAKSRAVLQAAIARDPDYPLYYYILACGDVESGDAASARQHLQQAFDRRANTLPGEKMPDPTTDDSILKLRQDKTFWAFVQSLPQN